MTYTWNRHLQSYLFSWEPFHCLTLNFIFLILYCFLSRGLFQLHELQVPSSLAFCNVSSNLLSGWIHPFSPYTTLHATAPWLALVTQKVLVFWGCKLYVFKCSDIRLACDILQVTFFEFRLVIFREKHHYMVWSSSKKEYFYLEFTVSTS